MTTAIDPMLIAAMEYERRFLIDNPHFEERPATMQEFLGPNYLNIEKHVRPAVRKV